MDYRDLLKRYMRTVIDAEGVSFVNDVLHTRVEFSEDEISELLLVEAESRAID